MASQFYNKQLSVINAVAEQSRSSIVTETVYDLSNPFGVAIAVCHVDFVETSHPDIQFYNYRLLIR